MHLPTFATTVAWPSIPRNPFLVGALRRPTEPPPVPAQPGTLAALLDNLPLSSMVEQGAPTDTTGYLELLAEVLEDGLLTDAEAHSLTELASHFELVGHHW